MPAESPDRRAVAFSDFLRSFTRIIVARPWVSLVLLSAVCIASAGPSTDGCVMCAASELAP